MNDKTQEEILVRKANLARERLLAVVDALDRKRHNLAHPMKRVSKKMPQPVSIAALGAAALIAIGTIGFLVAKHNDRKVKQFRRRPLFERQPAPRSFWVEIADRTAKALITFALIESGKFGIKRAANSVTAPVTSAGF